jgi:hypothetical protein
MAHSVASWEGDGSNGEDRGIKQRAANAFTPAANAAAAAIAPTDAISGPSA